MQKKGKPDVHKSLEGFDLKVNEFGELISNFEEEKLINFLNTNVEDKKLKSTKIKSTGEEE